MGKSYIFSHDHIILLNMLKSQHTYIN